MIIKGDGTLQKTCRQCSKLNVCEYQFFCGMLAVINGPRKPIVSFVVAAVTVLDRVGGNRNRADYAAGPIVQLFQTLSVLVCERPKRCARRFAGWAGPHQTDHDVVIVADAKRGVFQVSSETNPHGLRDQRGGRR
jgi:hypothetical protein